MSAPPPTDETSAPEPLTPHVLRGDGMTLDGEAVTPVFGAGREPLPFPPTVVPGMEDDGNVLPGGDEELPGGTEDDPFDIEEIPDDLPEEEPDLPPQEIPVTRY